MYRISKKLCRNQGSQRHLAAYPQVELYPRTQTMANPRLTTLSAVQSPLPHKGRGHLRPQPSHPSRAREDRQTPLISIPPQRTKGGAEHPSRQLPSNSSRSSRPRPSTTPPAQNRTTKTADPGRSYEIRFRQNRMTRSPEPPSSNLELGRQRPAIDFN